LRNKRFNDVSSQWEFDEARRAERYLVAEPDGPLDEMSMSDFIEVRNGQAEMSYEDFIAARKQG